MVVRKTMKESQEQLESQVYYLQGLIWKDYINQMNFFK